MIAGHLDVPPAAIGSESFSFQGKTYGYFGIAPSLLRIPLILIFKDMDGRWSRLMMLIGCTINLVCAYCILRMVPGDQAGNSRARQVLESLFILCAGIGSTNVFLVARSFTFHEAIMWGSAFAMLFTLMFLKYLARPRLRFLVATALFAFMSLHSRATTGAGALLALCILTTALIWRLVRKAEPGKSPIGLDHVARPFTHTIVAGAAVIIIVVSYFGVNYAKFRTFDAVPLKYYDFYVRNPRALEMTRGRQIHIENIPTTVASYFGFDGMWLDPRFPWLFPSREATFIGSPTIMVVEGFSTFPVSLPALSLLALLGFLPLISGSSEAVRRLRVPAAALFLGGGIVFATVAITERYLHDLYPALIACAAVGVMRIARERYVVRATVLVAVLTGVSIVFNCSFALENQRLDAWSMGGVPPSRRAEFKELQKSIYRFFRSPTRSGR